MRGLDHWIQRYFPCSFERGGSVLVAIGVGSTLIYVFSRIGFKDEFRELPQNLMILTFLVSAWGQRHQLKADSIIWLLGLAFLIPWLLFWINALIDYESAVKYRSLNDLLKLFLFLPLAWWMGGTREGAVRILVIAFLGLLTAVALDPDLGQSLARLVAGKRVDFDIYNAQHGAMFFGLGIIFCACLLARRLRQRFAMDRVNLLLVSTALLCVAGLLGTQTRAAMLAILATGFIALLRAIWQKYRLSRNIPGSGRSILVLALVAGLLAWPIMNALQDRLARETTAIDALLDGNLQEVPFSSLGIRIHTWVEALRWIAERPVTGWGQKARSDVIPLSQSFPDEIKERGFGHLHNGYLEILLGFGAVGFVFVGVLWILLWSRIGRTASADLFALALYGGIFFLILNFSESFFIYSSGEFALALIMAGGYSQYLAASLAGATSRAGRNTNSRGSSA